MNSYFAYIRVSTVKQGEHGSSLQEQRDAIAAFASRHELSILQWYEERETAAKTGRREFMRMVAALRKGKASGVIFHKIDRSARNLKDWSAVQDLAELGVDVRFTQESIKLSSNEGRLTGDFLAVISAHYIRNLREEVRKGIRGRLKQGLYPFKAHIGYLDQGGGRPKIPDPERAPFVQLAFELYATGTFSLQRLSGELFQRGLRSRSGKRLGVNRLAAMLRNPFYVGIIRIKKSGESYVGVHQSLVPKRLFDRVQDVLNGRLTARPLVHDYQFRRMIACAHCGFRLVGERQKGRVYYRCHTLTCPTRSFREDRIDRAIRAQLGSLDLTEAEVDDLQRRAASLAHDSTKVQEDRQRAIVLQLNALSNRLARLTDIYVDGGIERQLFDERKLALLMERKELEDEQARISAQGRTFEQDIRKYLELLKDLNLSYELANVAERREMIRAITSNFRADGENAVIELRSPFREIAKLTPVPTGGPHRDRPLTAIASIFHILAQHCTVHPAKHDDERLAA